MPFSKLLPTESSPNVCQAKKGNRYICMFILSIKVLFLYFSRKRTAGQLIVPVFSFSSEDLPYKKSLPQKVLTQDHLYPSSCIYFPLSVPDFLLFNCSAPCALCSSSEWSLPLNGSPLLCHHLTLVSGTLSIYIRLFAVFTFPVSPRTPGDAKYWLPRGYNFSFRECLPIFCSAYISWFSPTSC